MLSNYEIEKQLGKGTYGVVYKVKKKDDNKIYVLKQISLIGLTSAQKAEVKQEAQVLSKIKSKYVVKYYDSFEEDGKLNIIMEYCDNGDLNDFIERQKLTKHLLRENIVWKIFLKITLGLADIHKLKILHRDLKSLNIFLKNDEDIRVGDLGVAKILNQTFFAKTFIGTPYYLSPEICEDKPYNDKSDVWALGCILYELCTYQHPFTAKSQGGLILKILNDNPKPINSYYSEDLRNLINLIFDKNLEKRPSCYDILKKKYVIDKAKALGIFEDIKNSFPDIEKADDNNDNKEKNKIIKNNLIKIKPVIIKSNKNEVKKRPASGFGLFGRKGMKQNLKFNEIGNNKKKNENEKVFGIEKNDNNIKKKGFINKHIKIVKRDKNNKNNIPTKPIRKKVVVSPKKKDKDKDRDRNLLFKEADFFDKKRQINKIILQDKNINNNNNNNNPDDKIIVNQKNIGDNLSILNTKNLNNLLNKNIDHSIFNQNIDNTNNIKNISDNKEKNNINLDSMYDTKDFNNIFNDKNQSIFNEVKNNNNDNNNIKINNDNKNEINNNITKNTDTNIDIRKFNYSIDSNKDSFMNKEINKEEEKEKDKKIINEAIEELKEENKNNSSVESDIYKTSQRDKYQPKNVEENNKKDLEIKKDEFKDSQSSLNFTEIINDFSANVETTINSNNNTKNDFKIIVNNEEDKKTNKILENIDNNKSISDDNNSESDNKDYFSDDDKYEENENEEEKIKEIDINNEKEDDEKNESKDELSELKKKIDNLKKEISKLLGEEKYNYIIDICSAGIEGTNQEVVDEIIENFIKENSTAENKEKIYEISLLFILECKYYKMQKK